MNRRELLLGGLATLSLEGCASGALDAITGQQKPDKIVRWAAVGSTFFDGSESARERVESRLETAKRELDVPKVPVTIVFHRQTSDIVLPLLDKTGKPVPTIKFDADTIGDIFFKAAKELVGKGGKTAIAEISFNGRPQATFTKDSENDIGNATAPGLTFNERLNAARAGLNL